MTDPVPCVVVETLPAESVVSMVAGGRDLTRVGFPTDTLDAAGLRAGDRFLWHPDDDRVTDVVTAEEYARREAEALAEAERLFASLPALPWPREEKGK